MTSASAARRNAAAADLNVVPGAVNIDYSLDEQMRELVLEEKRRLTRLGLCYGRMKQFNLYFVDN